MDGGPVTERQWALFPRPNRPSTGLAHDWLGRTACWTRVANVACPAHISTTILSTPTLYGRYTKKLETIGTDSHTRKTGSPHSSDSHSLFKRFWPSSCARIYFAAPPSDHPANVKKAQHLQHTLTPKNTRSFFTVRSSSGWPGKANIRKAATYAFGSPGISLNYHWMQPQFHSFANKPNNLELRTQGQTRTPGQEARARGCIPVRR